MKIVIIYQKRVSYEILKIRMMEADDVQSVLAAAQVYNSQNGSVIMNVITQPELTAAFWSMAIYEQDIIAAPEGGFTVKFKKIGEATK